MKPSSLPTGPSTVTRAEKGNTNYARPLFADVGPLRCNALSPPLSPPSHSRLRLVVLPTFFTFAFVHVAFVVYVILESFNCLVLI